MSIAWQTEPADLAWAREMGLSEAPIPSQACMIPIRPCHHPFSSPKTALT